VATINVLNTVPAFAKQGALPCGHIKVHLLIKLYLQHMQQL